MKIQVNNSDKLLEVLDFFITDDGHIKLNTTGGYFYCFNKAARMIRIYLEDEKKTGKEKVVKITL